MQHYQAPVEDMQFILNDVWSLAEHVNTLPVFQEFSMDMVDAILAEAAKINQDLLLPLNQSGDQAACQFNQGKVTTPAGFKAAYQTFCEAGWPSLMGDPAYGGQGLPYMVGVLFEEMLCSSNLSFSLYPGLTVGVAHAIHKHGDDGLKQRYLPKLISGEWTGVMCLTESHSGSDLSLIRTKATVNDDGSYHINGSKIFITAGEHDLSDNIIHLVLARLADAPPGVKGLSLFLVPKFLVNDDGSLGERNGVACGSIEHKMGLKASATCVMNYDNAVGFLVGELNRGLACMFTVMNTERIAIGMQGLGQSELAYQNASRYAQERLQGRAATGAKYPDKAADPIIVHPDIKRMLLTMKAGNDALRALFVYVAQFIDIAAHHDDAAARQSAQGYVDLFTPVLKAYTTDFGFMSANLGLQVFGGHGYVQEWGMEQIVRDARIAQIYEGTNAIQAQDLLGRKVLGSNGQLLRPYLAEIRTFLQTMTVSLEEYASPLRHAIDVLEQSTQWLIDACQQSPEQMGCSACYYLELFALTSLAYQWCRMVSAAFAKHDEGNFYRNKLITAKFFMTHILPKVDYLATIIQQAPTTTMAMTEQHF